MGPPPKPPPPEMHGIPNPNNTEFIYLLGLEQCVEQILSGGKLVDPHPTPFICTQCGTDFTPSWKWDKGTPGKPKGKENKEVKNKESKETPEKVEEKKEAKEKEEKLDKVEKIEKKEDEKKIKKL